MRDYRLYILAFVVSFWDWSGASHALAEAPLPRPDHVVIVVLENHGYSSIIGSPAAPFINGLAERSALFTHYYAHTHPSQPNYLYLFSGSVQGAKENECPLHLTTPNLGHALLRAGLTFAGFAEDLPEEGSRVCVSGLYARKHAPWVNWQHDQANGLPPAANRPFSAFPTNYADLPTVSIVIPNNANNMHHGTDPDRIRGADVWVRRNLAGYLEWAQTHNSLCILTWDEDDGKEGNRIPTLFFGPMVRAGQYAQRLSHLHLLRTLEAMYGLPPVADRPEIGPIQGIWRQAGDSTR